MRQRKVKNVSEILNENIKIYIDNPKEYKGKWIGKYKKVCVEVGIGKGIFLTKMAKLNPDNLYIGIELNKSVLALAVKKLIKNEKENGNIENIRLIDMDARNLLDIFDKNEVENIYLNFSDPWPKKKHEKRRLTSDTFLNIYKEILKQGSNIEFKTDNRKLFEYTIINLNKNKINIEYISLDLHKENIFNISTEYEEKFSKIGPIYKLIFNFEKEGNKQC